MRSINVDSSTVWLPAHLSDFGLGDKKSHFWQNAPVTDWSKEQVSIRRLISLKAIERFIRNNSLKATALIIEIAHENTIRLI